MLCKRRLRRVQNLLMNLQPRPVSTMQYLDETLTPLRLFAGWLCGTHAS